MRRMFGFRRLLLTVVLAVPVWCADPDDGPGRGVARISLINGDVSVRRGDSGDWVAAAINAPLVVQDHISTGPNSRAEVQFDYANFLRLSSNSEVRFTELEHRRYQMQVARGTVTFRVLRNSEADVELSTPAASVRPSKKGVYRVTVQDQGPAEITVRSGEVEIYTPRGMERLRSGKTMLVRGTSADPEFQVASAFPEDDWDRWNERRDRQFEHSGAYRYVSRDIYGAEDLDAHGRWVWVPDYGYVWSPRVYVDWAPYRYGRWAWMDWYGWTWVSYDPWGWAPYHYGRWFWHQPYGWCWYPGGLYARHYWRPALVAFFGFGGYSGFHAGFGFGHVGWVPLAPYEPYYPWYGRHYYSGYRNFTYIDRSTNITNNINITNIYRNSRVQNGITAVSTEDFSRGRFTRTNIARVSHDQIREAGLVRGQIPIAPDTQSLRFSDREARSIPRTSASEKFFARRQPTSVERVPFAEQQRALAGAPASTTTVIRTPSTPGPAATATVPASRLDRGQGSQTAPPPGDSSKGWRRSGERSQPAPEATTVPRLTERSGSAGDSTRSWRRFGEPSAAGTATQTEPRVNRQDSRITRESNDGWRRFGATPRQDTAPTRPAGPPASRIDRDTGRDSGWRRFGEPGATGTGTQTEPRMNRQDSPLRRDFEQPRSPGGDRGIERQSIPRSERRPDRYDRGPRPESIQVAPPVVRERSSPPRMERRSEGGFGGGIPRGGEMRGPAARSEGGGHTSSRGEGARGGGGRRQ